MSCTSTPDSFVEFDLTPNRVTHVDHVWQSPRSLGPLGQVPQAALRPLPLSNRPSCSAKLSTPRLNESVVEVLPSFVGNRVRPPVVRNLLVKVVKGDLDFVTYPTRLDSCKVIIFDPVRSVRTSMTVINMAAVVRCDHEATPENRLQCRVKMSWATTLNN